MFVSKAIRDSYCLGTLFGYCPEKSHSGKRDCTENYGNVGGLRSCFYGFFCINSLRSCGFLYCFCCLGSSFFYSFSGCFFYSLWSSCFFCGSFCNGSFFYFADGLAVLNMVCVNFDFGISGVRTFVICVDFNGGCFFIRNIYVVRRAVVRNLVKLYL